jgi:hypothetical protein
MEIVKIPIAIKAMMIGGSEMLEEGEALRLGCPISDAIETW